MRNVFGVPCSKLTTYITGVDVECTDEIEAFALAYGASLTGKKSVVYMQDSGFCKCLNILLGLYSASAMPFPLLYLSVRTKPNYHNFVSNHVFSFLNLINYFPVKIVRQEDAE